jgi:hypothetical protein
MTDSDPVGGPVNLPNVVAVFCFAALATAACSDPSMVPPPLVNSGSYDWRDAYRGPNGYPLPGWSSYFARPQ